MKSLGGVLELLMVAMLMCGCAIGYNSALFVTRSNIGIDIESAPPTAEFSISRQEGVIAPVFEAGQVPPVLACFSTGSEGLYRIPFGARSVFAGGGAAVALAEEGSNVPSDETLEKGSVMCLTQKPTQDGWRAIPGPGEVKPLFLGVDTTLGVKIAWSGATSTIPDSIQVGYNRREMVLAPVTARDKKEDKWGDKERGYVYGVWLPSFLAVLDTKLNIGPPTDTSFYYGQILATGRAATELGQDSDLRGVVRESAKQKK